MNFLEKRERAGGLSSIHRCMRPTHTHTQTNDPTGKQVPEKTEEQRALIELALHQNSLFTCLDEEQISKCVRACVPGQGACVCPAFNRSRARR